MDYAKLGTYCKVISGYAFKSSDWQDEGIPVIKIGNISNGCDVIPVSYTHLTLPTIA